MPPGRDQVKAMERLARLLAVLDAAGVVGATTEQLLEVGQYGEAAPQDQLGLDLRNLRKQGWQIDNLNPTGETGRYRMVSGDNRLRVKLTPPQTAALQRAVLLSQRADLAKRLGVPAQSLPAGIGSEVVPQAESTSLSLALQAVQLRSRIRFTYKGSPRDLHPAAVRFQNYRWYLSGVEDGHELLKHFIIGDMSEVSLAAPGSAEATPTVRRIPLHPLLWTVDEPTEVTLRTTVDFVPDVVRWLNEPHTRSEAGDTVGLTYTVTHRQAFRARLYVLGPRVTIVHGAEVHREMLAELRKIAGL